MTTFFDQPGHQNTSQTLKLALKKAQKDKIKTIVLASTSGATGLKALDICQDLKVIAVGSYKNRSKSEKFKEFRKAGGKAIFAYDDVSYNYSQEAQTRFRQMAGEGGKVAIEVVVAAVLVGLVKKDEKVIGIGGTYPGADTALVIKASNNFDEKNIEEIICCPKR